MFWVLHAIYYCATRCKRRIYFNPALVVVEISRPVREGSLRSHLNDDIEVAITKLFPTAAILTTTAEQVDPDATPTHS